MNIYIYNNLAYFHIEYLLICEAKERENDWDCRLVHWLIIF